MISDRILSDPILHDHLPSAPWMAEATRRLPGVQPVPMSDWLIRDERYAEQMALRDHLLAAHRARVFECHTGAEAACAELRDLVVAHLPDGFAHQGRVITRPDGVVIDLDTDHPLITAASLVQEDLCILTHDALQGEHLLSAAVLCFPASWTLAEKIGRPLTAIHIPVEKYDDAMAKRVQRLFDMVRVDHPLWRQNALFYQNPALFQPASEAQPRKTPERRPEFLRSERQVILRLPLTGAMVFSIHTWVLPFGQLSPEQAEGLAAHPVHYAGRSV